MYLLFINDFKLWWSKLVVLFVSFHLFILKFICIFVWEFLSSQNLNLSFRLFYSQQLHFLFIFLKIHFHVFLSFR
jgi:hypothetical protein